MICTFSSCSKLNELLSFSPALLELVVDILPEELMLPVLAIRSLPTDELPERREEEDHLPMNWELGAFGGDKKGTGGGETAV